jgi:hypothetical protein
MAQTTREIENRIENARADLDANLNELEHKVKSIADWRVRFRKNPMTMLGLAFGFGLMLARLTRSSKPKRRVPYWATRRSRS